LVFEKDTDAYARERDERIMKLANMAQVQKAAGRINNGIPDKPLDVPESVPDPWDHQKMSLGDMEDEKPDSGRDLNAAHRNTGKDH
jgi:cryptochrome